MPESIKRERKAAFPSREEMAERSRLSGAQLSVDAISRIENGTCDSIEKIAKYLFMLSKELRIASIK
jgi:transcriptional regulator with XRE-family HTH domain